MQDNALFMEESTYNLIFFISAILFNLIIAIVYQYMRLERLDILKKFGIPMALLIIPFSLVLFEFIKADKSINLIIGLIIVIGYLLIVFLLDQVFKYDFRSKLVPHIIYIIILYMSLYSLLVITFDINNTYGWIVSVCFWILLISLITVIISNIRKSKSEA